jgi:geranylgeranyl pyrophosphate synthase
MPVLSSTVSKVSNTQERPHPAVGVSSTELVGPHLKMVEADLLDLPAIQPPELQRAVAAIVAAGGKRLRPMMSLLTSGMFGNLENQRAIHVAAAVEMLHTATLVHDDLIDGSLVRRGAATLNAAWTPITTVLTGDYLMAYAAGLAARGQNVRVMDLFAETLGIVVGGEMRQAFTDVARRRTRDDYEQRIYDKTASMFVLAVVSAGQLAGANDDQLNALRSFGRLFGNAFQIIDDVLDFTGDQATVGKPVGSDLRRGLVTLPTICYIEQHGEQDLACALEGKCTPTEMDEIVARIRTSGAVDKAIGEARNMAQEAVQCLDVFQESPYRDALAQIALQQVARNR